jgi:hypothetical protein
MLDQTGVDLPIVPLAEAIPSRGGYVRDWFQSTTRPARFITSTLLLLLAAPGTAQPVEPVPSPPPGSIERSISTVCGAEETVDLKALPPGKYSYDLRVQPGSCPVGLIPTGLQEDLPVKPPVALQPVGPTMNAHRQFVIPDDNAVHKITFRCKSVEQKYCDYTYKIEKQQITTTGGPTPTRTPTQTPTVTLTPTSTPTISSSGTAKPCKDSHETKVMAKDEAFLLVTADRTSDCPVIVTGDTLKGTVSAGQTTQFFRGQAASGAETVHIDCDEGKTGTCSYSAKVGVTMGGTVVEKSVKGKCSDPPTIIELQASGPYQLEVVGQDDSDCSAHVTIDSTDGAKFDLPLPGNPAPNPVPPGQPGIFDFQVQKNVIARVTITCQGTGDQSCSYTYRLVGKKTKLPKPKPKPPH